MNTSPEQIIIDIKAQLPTIIKELKDLDAKFSSVYDLAKFKRENIDEKTLEQLNKMLYVIEKTNGYFCISDLLYFLE